MCWFPAFCYGGRPQLTPTHLQLTRPTRLVPGGDKWLWYTAGRPREAVIQAARPVPVLDSGSCVGHGPVCTPTRDLKVGSLSPGLWRSAMIAPLKQTGPSLNPRMYTHASAARRVTDDLGQLNAAHNSVQLSITPPPVRHEKGAGGRPRFESEICWGSLVNSCTGLLNIHGYQWNPSL